MQLAFEVLEGLLGEDDEVVGVWYLMGWLHYLQKDADSARFYLEQMQMVGARMVRRELYQLAGWLRMSWSLG